VITPEQEHADWARDPKNWFSRASDLHSAAGALWYCMQNNTSQNIAKSLGLGENIDMTEATWRVYRMLCGMTLELAYKAIAVSKGKPVLQIHDCAVAKE
jgi:hypothetical protein